MSQRIELSFKNKEIRMWFYIVVVPVFLIGSIIMFIGGVTYNYVAWVLLVIAWIIFYTWRFLYRRKQKNENNAS